MAANGVEITRRRVDTKDVLEITTEAVWVATTDTDTNVPDQGETLAAAAPTTAIEAIIQRVQINRSLHYGRVFYFLTAIAINNAA